MKLRQEEIINFLNQLGPFDWAVTMNLMKRHPYYQTSLTPQIFEQTGRHYFSMVNKAVFKRKYRYGHEKLKGIFCMEIGDIEKQPHLHYAIGCDDWVIKEKVLYELKKAHRKIDWAKGNIHITPYGDEGWLKYLIKTGFESVVLP